METPAPSVTPEQTKKLKILVVEDDLFLRDLLTNELKKEPYEISIANDGPSALKAIETATPELIILDILLPGIDGYDVLAEIKKNEKFAGVPVIVLSNLSSKVDVSRALNLGAADFVTKAQFTLKEIVDRIKIVIEGKYPTKR